MTLCDYYNDVADCALSLQAAMPTPPELADAHPLAVVVTVPLDRHPAAVYLARLGSARSRRVMRGALDTMARLLSEDRCDALSLDWSRLRYPHSAAVRAALAERYAVATTNQHLSALRGVLKECWRLGYVDAEAYQRAADVQSVRGSVLPRGRALRSGELRAVFNACSDDGKPLAVRDAAILAVLYGAGLRRAEASALDLADFDTDAGALRVRGKGNKERLAYVRHGARDALGDWLALRGATAGPLFWPVTKGGKLRPRRLSAQAMLYVTRRRGQRAGVEQFSPHDLRRSFISDLLDVGADLSTVQRLAGHAQVQTTARYDRRGESAKQEAAELLHVPYVSRRRP
jgi:site-specific recombinase XerD